MSLASPRWWLLGVTAALLTALTVRELRACTPFLDVRMLARNRALMMPSFVVAAAVSALAARHSRIWPLLVAGAAALATGSAGLLLLTGRSPLQTAMYAQAPANGRAVDFQARSRASAAPRRPDITRTRKAITMATWLITGCSTGLGRALASTALDRGETVVVTARDAASVEDLARSHPGTALALALDVTDHAQGRDVVRAAQERFGTIDVVVNNAGHGYRAAVEEGEEDQVRELFATNFFGPVAMIQAVLPGMRERRSGTIVNISSIGARSSLVGAGHYAASKAALEALTASLRKEVQPLGITVMAVEPGASRTSYKRSLAQPREAISDYAGTVGARRNEDSAEDANQPGDPATAAQAIITAVQSPDTPLVLVLGPDALTWFRDAMKELNADADAWEQTSLSTSFPG